MENFIQALRTYLKPIVPRSAWDFIRKTRVRYSQKSFKRYWVQQDYAGQKLHVLIADPVSHEWYAEPWLMPEEILFLKNKSIERGHDGLKEGAIVFDLGAHQAVVAAILANQIGSAGKVIALEANKHNFNVGIENITKNNLSKNLLLIHAAAGASEGTLFFNENFNGQVDDGLGTMGKVEVKVHAPDTLMELYGNPDVIFLDVEGFEGEVLKGTAKILVSNRTDFFIEIHAAEELERFGSSLERILSYFPDDKFSLYAKILDIPSKFKPMAECEINPKTYRKRFYLIAMTK